MCWRRSGDERGSQGLWRWVRSRRTSGAAMQRPPLSSRGRWEGWTAERREVGNGAREGGGAIGLHAVLGAAFTSYVSDESLGADTNSPTLYAAWEAAGISHGSVCCSGTDVKSPSTACCIGRSSQQPLLQDLLGQQSPATATAIVADAALRAYINSTITAYCLEGRSQHTSMCVVAALGTKDNIRINNEYTVPCVTE